MVEPIWLLMLNGVMMRPPWCDKTCVLTERKQLDIDLHILHLTSGIEADWLNGITSLHGRESRALITEALPQHLTYDERDVERLGTRLKMNPQFALSKGQARFGIAFTMILPSPALQQIMPSYARFEGKGIPSSTEWNAGC